MQTHPDKANQSVRWFLGITQYEDKISKKAMEL